MVEKDPATSLKHYGGRESTTARQARLRRKHYGAAGKVPGQAGDTFGGFDP
jgi:hypothetical protein